MSISWQVSISRHCLFYTLFQRQGARRTGSPRQECVMASMCFRHLCLGGPLPPKKQTKKTPPKLYLRMGLYKYDVPAVIIHSLLLHSFFLLILKEIKTFLWALKSIHWSEALCPLCLTCKWPGCRAWQARGEEGVLAVSRPGFPHLDPLIWEKKCALIFNSLHLQLSMSSQYDWAAHQPHLAVPAPLTAVEITGVLRLHYISDNCLEIACSLITSSKLWWLLDQP